MQPQTTTEPPVVVGSKEHHFGVVFLQNLHVDQRS